MPDHWEYAIAYVLHSEGGLSNHKEDRGGLTKFGITKRSHPEVDILNLTLEGAKEIYKRDYWSPYPYNSITDKKTATKIFDHAVNMGTSRAVTLFQRCLAEVAPCTVDGKLGKRTVALANDIGSQVAISLYKVQLKEYYERLVKADSSQAKFIKGWLNRTERTPP